MSLLIDIIVIAAFTVSLISGIKKGFIKSVIRVLIIVLAMIGAVNYTPALSVYLNDNYVEAPIVDIARASINDLLSDNVDIKTLLDERPVAFVKVLARFGVTPDDVQMFTAENNGDQSKTVEKIAEYMAVPVARSLSKVIAFIALFLGLFVLLWLVGLIICLVVKLPVLNKIDKALGGALGALSGIVIAWGISVAICELMPQLSTLYDGAVSESVIENSVIVKWLGGFDPISIF